MRRVAGAAIAYFAGVFALGFALGTLRVIYVAPALGELPATMLELPIMLTASWYLSGLVVRRWAVPPALPARAAMGALAFTLLIGAELAVAAALFHRPLDVQFRTMVSGAGLAGLISQIMFAVIPVLSALHRR